MAGKLSLDCQLSWTLGPAGYREVSPGLVTWGEWTLHCGSWGLKGCGLGSQQGATALHWKPASLLRVLFGFWTDNPSVPTSLRRWSVDAAAVQPCVLGWWGRGSGLSATQLLPGTSSPPAVLTHLSRSTWGYLVPEKGTCAAAGCMGLSSLSAAVSGRSALASTLRRENLGKMADLTSLSLSYLAQRILR